MKTLDLSPVLQFHRTPLQKRIDKKVLARVKRGIALLEREYGPDWVEHIDLSTLDLAYEESCVLGQLYGEYRSGVRRLCLNRPTDQGVFSAEAHGFEREDHEEYAVLQEAWEYVLTPKVTVNA